MNSEIFNKDCSLKKRAPKQYECLNCFNKTSNPKKIKFGFASIYMCNKCSGTIQQRKEYEEWSKRTSGQWDMEEKILNYLKRNRLCSKKEIFDGLCITPKEKFIFDKSFSDMCYQMKLDIIKINEDERVYRLIDE